MRLFVGDHQEPATEGTRVEAQDSQGRRLDRWTSADGSGRSQLQLYFSGFIQHAVPTVAISQIQSNCQFLLRNIPALRCRSGATFFIAGLLFICAASTFDNLGAYIHRIPPETGLLIPSGYDSYGR